MEPQEEHKSSSLAIGLLAVVIGLLVGFGGAVAMKSTQKVTEVAAPTVPKTIPSTATKAADLRVTFNNLARQDTNLIIVDSRDTYDARPSAAAESAAIDTNLTALAATITGLYGDATGQKFLALGRSHTAAFLSYAAAVKKGDKPATDKAVADINTYIAALASFYNEANPNLAKQALSDLATEHVGLVKSAIDAYAAKDYSKSLSQQQAAAEQISKLADLVAGAAVKQNPEKY